MDAIVGAGKVATVNAADFQTMPPSMVVTLAFHVPVGALKGTTTVPLIVVAVTVHHHNCVVQYGIFDGYANATVVRPGSKFVPVIWNGTVAFPVPCCRGYRGDGRLCEGANRECARFAAESPHRS